jgi:hypothetical protein
MPKPHTFPTLFDEVLKLNISKLKEWGYLNPKQLQNGTITWSRNNNKTGSISIKANTLTNEPFIELDYHFRDEPRSYKVYLTSIPSNLGKGVVWYFLCPETNKRCRILYSIGGYFLHREAFNGCMYESQTWSKRTRDLIKSIEPTFGIDQLYEQLYKKNFKKTYAGKKTKRYVKLKEALEKANRVDINTINKAIMS